uniref:Uncharacterized protein n=1 Tax=Oryza nivara TaxID=4536 RepID=A0A0E0GRC9_ORYNI
MKFCSKDRSGVEQPRHEVPYLSWISLVPPKWLVTPGTRSPSQLLILGAMATRRTETKTSIQQEQVTIFGATSLAETNNLIQKEKTRHKLSIKGRGAQLGKNKNRKGWAIRSSARGNGARITRRNGGSDHTLRRCLEDEWESMGNNAGNDELDKTDGDDVDPDETFGWEENESY